MNTMAITLVTFFSVLCFGPKNAMGDHNMGVATDDTYLWGSNQVATEPTQPTARLDKLERRMAEICEQDMGAYWNLMAERYREEMPY